MINSPVNIITKNPTNERHFVGEYAMFIAGAYNYDRIEWRFTAPNGGDYSLDAFKAQFPFCSVEGQDTTTLTVHNIQTSMEGWRAYCRFYLGNAYCDTTSANIGVSVQTAPVVYNPWGYEPAFIINDGVCIYSDGTVV